MKSLRDPQEPFDVEVLPGVVFTVTPRTALDLAVAQAAAQRRLDRLADGQDACVEAGVMPGRAIDLADADTRAGLFHILTAEELAVRHVIAWTGVEGHDEATPDAVRAVMALWPDGAPLPVGELFFRKFMERHREMAAAKKESGTAASGTSEEGAVPNTAPDAEGTDFPALPD